jgi:hypothetical protein
MHLLPNVRFVSEYPPRDISGVTVAITVLEEHIVGIATYWHQTIQVGNVALWMDSGARECVAPEVLE